METIITDPERNYILKVPTHGTGRISKKPFSIASPAMQTAYRRAVIMYQDICAQKHKNHFSIFIFISFLVQFYFVIVDMYVFIVIVFL